MLAISCTYLYIRFQSPEPADGWEGVRDATNEGDDCMQFNLLSYTLEGTEDCLYANVYTPEVSLILI